MSLNSILATAPLTTQNFVLKANGTTIGNSLIFDNGTNVGIGNTNTSYTLDVSGTARFTGALTAGSTTLTGSSSTMLFINTTNALGSASVHQQSGTNIGWVGNGASSLIGGTTSDFGINSQGKLFLATGGSERMSISSTGIITVITAISLANNNIFPTGAGIFQGSSFLQIVSGTGGFTVNNNANLVSNLIVSNAGLVTISALGSGAVTATSGVLSATSDMNLKISDGYIDTALDKILKLTPRYFYWKEETGLPTNLRQLGFYAQEVNEALGEEASNTPKKENEKWGIYDRAIIAMLTKGMQEQQALITSLQSQINAIVATK
jgi:hypothetical protein